MSGAWTPGPWKADYDDNGFFVVLAEGAPSPYIAATGSEGETNDANATLIAAAPDLYAALDEAINYLAVYAATSGDSEASACLDKCTAALSLARGEKP